jgi:hypothetical protein
MKGAWLVGLAAVLVGSRAMCLAGLPHEHRAAG